MIRPNIRWYWWYRPIQSNYWTPRRRHAAGGRQKPPKRPAPSRQIHPPITPPGCQVQVLERPTYRRPERSTCGGRETGEVYSQGTRNRRGLLPGDARPKRSLVRDTRPEKTTRRGYETEKVTCKGYVSEFGRPSR